MAKELKIPMVLRRIHGQRCGTLHHAMLYVYFVGCAAHRHGIPSRQWLSFSFPCSPQCYQSASSGVRHRYARPQARNNVVIRFIHAMNVFSLETAASSMEDQHQLNLYRNDKATFEYRSGSLCMRVKQFATNALESIEKYCCKIEGNPPGQ